MYLYLRNQFGFKEIDFSLFNAYVMLIMLLGKILGFLIVDVVVSNLSIFKITLNYYVGSLFTLGIMSQMLKINDAVIGLIATLFDIATAVGFLLATRLPYLFYG